MRRRALLTRDQRMTSSPSMRSRRTSFDAGFALPGVRDLRVIRPRRWRCRAPSSLAPRLDTRRFARRVSLRPILLLSFGRALGRLARLGLPALSAAILFLNAGVNLLAMHF